jgi:hypothetical protein
LDRGRLYVRHVAGVALMLLVAVAGARLVGGSPVAAVLDARQAVRAAPIHPFGAAAGLLVFLLSAVCVLGIRSWAHQESARRFQAWALREL